ncbi:DNA gyrase/topoisomerase IV subunit A [Cryomorphaceae bacterium 1068]|nr:DNA gyrase/topoisomerase IV subunit A [Cryomorphaceae bacterium 1068]
MAEEEKEDLNGQEPEGFLDARTDEEVIQVKGLYKNWFLDYASYVILERAVPAVNDGLKPVQRRILHAMKDLDDGRYNKVANIIGHTMKYHPHGDASIGDALVQLGQKDLLIDTQGNWGNTLTGDGSAAPRYIEARLSKFALEVVFNHKTTKWGLSYDGRNKEPFFLPVKFPLLLAQGAEGIAVGLACKILPHNFNELIDASIGILRGKKPNILPDFPNGGMADFTNYNDGLRGGKVRIRAKMRQQDKKTLIIDEIPHGTTTGSLIESIIKANDKGKIKIKKIEDNTSDKAEIIVHLPPNISPDKTMDALYAFTDCEVSISPNSCVIENEKPRFVGVNEILKINTEQTVELLKQELDIRKSELEEQWHFSSLEKIFIENRIYRDIEEAETWEEVIGNIDEGLKPHIKHLKRAVTEDDIVRLTEIRIKRISKFDKFKADEKIAGLEAELEEVQNYLDNLVDYAIDYYKKLKKKYGEGRDRKTEIKIFDSIEAAKVVVANKKLYVNREEGFIGYGLRKDEFVCDCSDIDDIIVFRNDGTMMVTKVDTKKFVGKDIVHVGVWKKGDKRTIYNMVYQDGPKGAAYVKRFPVNSITRDKEYDLTAGNKGSKLLYFTANPNGEAEVVQVLLRPKANLRKAKFDYDFADLAIKGRGAKGNTLSKHLIRKVEMKEEGASTLAPRKIWFDDVVQRLNPDGRGTFLGSFKGDNKILSVYQGGYYRISGYDLSTRFDEDLILIEKFDPEMVVTAVYWEGEKEQYNVKRFNPELSQKPVEFITEHENSRLEFATTHPAPIAKIQFDKRSADLEDEEVELAEFISVKGISAMGNRLTPNKVKAIDRIEPEMPTEEPDIEENKEGLKSDQASENTESENSDDSSGGQATLF